MGAGMGSGGYGGGYGGKSVVKGVYGDWGPAGRVGDNGNDLIISAIDKEEGLLENT